MANGSPPAGATLVTDNPAPPAFAPSRIPGQPPKGATLIRDTTPSAMPNAGLSGPAKPPLPEGLRPSSLPQRVLDRIGQNMQSVPDTVNKFLKETGGHPENVWHSVGEVVAHAEAGLAGVTTPGIIARLLNKEDPANIIGDASIMMAGGREGISGISSMLEDMARLSDKPTLTIAEASRGLTDAVNPHPQHMEKFEGTLNEQLPRIADYAKRNGIVVNNRAALTKAMGGAGDEAYHDYYDQYVEPTKDTRVFTGNIPGYQGKTIDYNTATIQNLDNRLSTINATLYPKFQKGGVAAEAAISAEAAASLDAEAAAIRETMNQAIGAKLGIDPSEIAKHRSTFGSLRDAADKAERAMNEERFGTNLERRGKDIPTDKAKAVRWGIRKLTTRNPDKAVASVMGRIQLKPPTPATPTYPSQPAPFPRAPVTQGMKGTQREIETTGTPESEIAAHQQRMQERIQQAKQAAEARQQQNAKARQRIKTRIASVKVAADKLGPKASVKEIMAEADKYSSQ